MDLNKLIKSIDMDVEDGIYRLAVNLVNTDELYLECNYDTKEITSSEIYVNRIHSKYTLSDYELDKYMKYFDIFNSILYNNIQYNITRVKMAFLNIVDTETPIYENILYEEWYYYHSNKDNIPGLYEHPPGYIDIYTRVIHDRGISIDKYNNIDNSNSVVISDTTDMVIIIKNKFKYNKDGN